MTTPTTLATEKIKCPECGLVQTATVTQNESDPFATYLHECEQCKYMIMESEWEKVPTDADGNDLIPGDRVYAIDFDCSIVYGTFIKNTHPKTRAYYQWSVVYEDGEECIVLDFSQLWKVK